MNGEPLVRLITCDDNYVELSLMIDCAYIERFDFEGAQLIMDFNDQESMIRDDSGVKVGAILKVTFDDLSVTSFTEKFEIIGCMPKQGHVFEVNALQWLVAKSKEPAIKPKFFVNKTIEHILKALLPDADKFDLEAVSGVFTYHLLQDMSPSELIRKIERDLSCRIYILRGVVYLMKCETIEAQEPATTLEYNNPAAPYQIVSKSPFDVSKMWARGLGKKYFSWSMTEGLVPDSSQDGVPVFASGRSRAELDNLGRDYLPVLNMVCFGSLQLQPAQKLKMIFHRRDVERVIDESLPDEAAISRITHYQRGVDYTCSIEVAIYEQF